MQFNHYEWTYDVTLFGAFKTAFGDTLVQTGIDEYTHKSKGTGETSNLTLSNLAIEDLLKKEFLKLVGVVGEPTVEDFSKIKPFVLHADKQEALNPGTVPVNSESKSVEEPEAVEEPALVAALLDGDALENEVIAKTIKKVVRSKKVK